MARRVGLRGRENVQSVRSLFNFWIIDTLRPPTTASDLPLAIAPGEPVCDWITEWLRVRYQVTVLGPTSGDAPLAIAPGESVLRLEAGYGTVKGHG